MRLLTPAETARLKTIYPDLPKSPKNCPTCQGRKTFTWLDQGGQPAPYACPCEDQWLLHRFLLNSGIGKAYQRLGWADVIQVPHDAMALASRYVENHSQYINAGRGIILHGEAKGTGKTLLVNLILKMLLGEGVDCYFAQFNEMLDGYTKTWRDQDEALWFRKRVKNAGVLAVDDVGRENKGRMNVSESMFDDVIRSRVRDARPTLMTTNETLDNIIAGYSSNVMSLMTESSDICHVLGTDYRPERRTAQDAEMLGGLTRPLRIG